MISTLEADELSRSFQNKVMAPAKARGVANRFILENLRDGFCAGKPSYALVQTEPVWIVPILFAGANRATNEIGEVIVQALSCEIIGFTPVVEVMRNAHAAAR
jgi:hypothetical protein